MKTIRFAVKYELDSEEVFFYVDISEDMIEGFRKFNEELVLGCDFESIIEKKVFSHEDFFCFMGFCEDKELVKRYWTDLSLKD